MSGWCIDCRNVQCVCGYPETTIEEAIHKGRHLERSAIVAWLRKQCDGLRFAPMSSAREEEDRQLLVAVETDLANAIEKGEHE